MDAISSTSRQEKVLEVVRKNTLRTLEKPSSEAQWIHAGAIADTLKMDRANVARELNKLYRDGQLIKLQGKPTLYICRATLSRQYPGIFFPSTLPKGSNPMEYSVPRERETVQQTPVGMTELESMIGVEISMKEAILHAKAAVMYPGHGLHTLITGSVGVGKANFAENMYNHAVSKGALPADAPFIMVNCREHNSTPRLLMNQLFGYSREAAPKGEKSRRGLIERAAGGILCLNGVEKLPPDVQDVLITLLEKNIYTRIGEASVTRYANVMVIAISTESMDSPYLQALSQRFPVQIQIPDLKNRHIQELAEILIDTFQQEAQSTGLNFRISKEVFSCFLKATYPGNLGELSSAVRTTCSLAYLEYSSTMPQPKIMEIQFHHLLPDVLRSIREDTGKDQQIRNLFSHQDFSYILFSPTGFSTDQHNGPHFLELLHGVAKIDHSDSLLSAPLIIANEHLRHYLGRNAQNYVNRFTVLQDLFPDDVLEAVRRTLTLQSDFAYLLNLPNGIYHLTSCIHDELRGKLPLIPNALWLVNNLRSVCPQEMEVVDALQRNLEEKGKSRLSDSAICYVTACLSMAHRRSTIGTVQVMLVCHGKDVATNMAEYVNDSMNTTAVHGICYHAGMAFETLLEQVADQARKIDQGCGILLMVDMEPLTQLHEHILQTTGIHTETVSNVSLPLLLSAARRAVEEQTPLHLLAEDAQASTMAAGPRKESSFLDRTINEVLAPALTFLNPQKTVDVLSATLTEILRSLHLVWSTEIAIKFIFHCSHMLERLIQGDALRYDRLKVFVNQNADLMNELERQMQYPSEVFGVSIPASELAYVAEIFLPYLN